MRNAIRPILNVLRSVNKLPFLEKALAKKTKGKPMTSFWVRLLPSVELYSRGSVREVERDGIRYRLDISDYIEYVIYFGIAAEPKEALYSSVKEGMNILDVGTNMGETLLNFAMRNTTGKNFGFEPVPFLYEKAKANIALNSFSNIILNNLAVADKPGSLFFEIPKNRNFGSISMSYKPGGDSKEVKALTVDAYVQENGVSKVDLIKIDVEGFEVNVLKGSMQTIQRDKPLLFIEVVDKYLKKTGASAALLINMVRELGYTIKNADTYEEVMAGSLTSDTHLDIICKMASQD